MSQITIYLSAEVEKRARSDARRAKKSLSAYIATLVEPKPRAQASVRAKEIIGSARHFTLPDDSDLAPLDEP